MILVTGGAGFVGSALVARLARERIAVRASFHRKKPELPASFEAIQVGLLSRSLDWSEALQGVDVVVHTAARVHVMRDTATDPLAEFRETNVEGTLRLARQAAATGVGRFVYISSVKVHGESTFPGRPFTEVDEFAPQDNYGISKMEAEQGLRAIAAQNRMEIVIIRPPLVYGPGVRANFLRLMQLATRGVILPLGGCNNQRSLIGLDNLVDFIMTCVQHPAAAGQTFLVSDGEDLSTPELVRRLGRAAGRSARLLSVPVWLLQVGARLLGKREALIRLCGNLQVDISAARKQLGWSPPVSVDEGLRRAVAGLGK